MDLKETLVSKQLLLKKNIPFQAIEELREKGIETFEKKGFPNKKIEDWKYTSLHSILDKNYETEIKDLGQAVEYKDVKKYLVHEIDSYKIIFLNGKYSSFLSETTHDEADICILSSALQKDKYFSILENYLGKIAPNSEYFVDLNNAFLKEGAFIHIPNNTILSKPIQIVYFSNEENQDTFYQHRNLVVLGNNCQATIIERYQTLNGKANFTNVTTEISIGENSKLDWNKIQNDSENASLIDQVYCQLERDSETQFHTFSFGGKFIRNTLEFKQLGENSNSILKSICIGGAQQLIDNHTKVEHTKEHCESHELYRYILDDSAKGIFNGKIVVDKKAQKLSAFQQNNTILLSDKASIDTKPQLEIFADDVKCSHGCTVGQLDESAMFYLQSRGIPKKEAQAMLLFGFANDILQSVQIPELKEKVYQLIALKLGVNIDF